MATGQIWTDNGNKILINRTFKSVPDYSTLSQFKVGTGTTTPTASDTDLVTPVTIDVDNFKNFVSGYPTIDETNQINILILKGHQMKRASRLLS